MTEEEKHNQIVATLEILEVLNSLIEACNQAAALPYSKLTQEDWEVFQEGQGIVAHVLTEIKEQFIETTPKLVDNDAFYAHYQAVMLAP